MTLGQQPGLVCQYKAKAFNLGTKSKPLTMVTKALQDGAGQLCSLIFYCSSSMLCNPTPGSSYCSSLSQACLCLAMSSVAGMPLSHMASFFSFSSLIRHHLPEAFPDYSPTPALYPLLTPPFVHITNQNLELFGLLLLLFTCLLEFVCLLTAISPRAGAMLEILQVC